MHFIVLCICEGVECVLRIADPQIALGCDLSGLMVGITARRMRPSPLLRQSEYDSLHVGNFDGETLGHFDFSFPVTVIAR